MCIVKCPGTSRKHGLRAWGRYLGTQPVQHCAYESRKTLGLGGSVGPSVVVGAACNSQQPRVPGRNRTLQNFPAHPPALNPRLTPSSSSLSESRPSTPESFTHLVPARRALWRFFIARCCDLWVSKPRRRLTRVNCRQKPEYLRPGQLAPRNDLHDSDCNRDARNNTPSHREIRLPTRTRSPSKESNLLARSTKRASDLRRSIPPSPDS